MTHDLLWNNATRYFYFNIRTISASFYVFVIIIDEINKTNKIDAIVVIETTQFIL